MSEQSLRARLSVGVGRAEQLHLRDRLDELETAVQEERSFLPALTSQVAELEASVLTVLERTGAEV